MSGADRSSAGYSGAGYSGAGYSGAGYSGAGYSGAGVDEVREQAAFASVMRPWLEKTATLSRRVQHLSGLGHFASVMRIDGGPCIALTTDGVGTKILVAQAVGRYESVGIDCVANNVNDLVCIGADPVAMLDYIAVNMVDEAVLEALAHGLFVGAGQAGISIPGGEIAQVADMLAAPSGPPPGVSLDLVGTAIGLLAEVADGSPPAMVDGSRVVAGDVVIGLPSSGLHSNGYSLARRALLGTAGYTLDDAVPGTGRCLADELLEPTRIYVGAARAMWRQAVDIHGFVNISGGGLLNLLRLPAGVGFELDALPPPPPIFTMIQGAGAVRSEEMYATFNMGVGACVVVPADSADHALSVLGQAGEDPITLGRASDRAVGTVELTKIGLSGRGDAFSASPGRPGP